HRPEPVGAPRLMMVGDYMFDATINGVMDSAEVATDIIVADVLQRRRQQSQSDSLRGESSAEALNAALEHVEELMSVQSVMDILKATWGLERGAKLLHVGSGAGSMVAALRALGFDATGVECSREAGQALANLLDNAIKYAAPMAEAAVLAGGPPLTVDVGLEDKGGTVDIVVADRGPGIAQNDRERVLQRFVRLQPSRSVPGSGLGLSLVAAVARLHGGAVALEDNCPGLKVRLSLKKNLPPEGVQNAASPQPMLTHAG
ncbi:MAG: ATP-binding protein, partial [Rhodomicrobium sp.]